jgi:hypothetical protein
MAQFLGGLIMAAIAFVFGLYQLSVFNHLISSGCFILGLVVFLSTDSFMGGVFATILGIVLLGMGIVSVKLIAIVAAVWILVKWGFGK